MPYSFRRDNVSHKPDRVLVKLLLRPILSYTGCAISSHTPCSPAAHAFPDDFWGAGVGFMDSWLSLEQYNIR